MFSAWNSPCFKGIFHEKLFNVATYFRYFRNMFSRLIFISLWGLLKDQVSMFPAHEDLLCKFLKIVKKHASLRTVSVRVNDELFMNKTWRKEIYSRSRLQKVLKRNRTREDESYIKNQKNKCSFLMIKPIKNYLRRIAAAGG